MKALIEGALVVAFLSLGCLNLEHNPFLATNTAYANDELCEGPPPGENCECCQTCGCWSCEE